VRLVRAARCVKSESKSEPAGDSQALPSGAVCAAQHPPALEGPLPHDPRPDTAVHECRGTLRGPGSTSLLLTGANGRGGQNPGAVTTAVRNCHMRFQLPKVWRHRRPSRPICSASYPSVSRHCESLPSMSCGCVPTNLAEQGHFIPLERCPSNPRIYFRT
jgi:hypothetical protein